MGDIFSKQKRSKIMSSVSDKDTKPELIVRKYLHSKGFRYLKNDKRYPGTPDIVLPKYNTIIFVHGCFWHGHDCKAGKLPNSRKDFWKNKILKNRERDLRKQKKLEKEGWNILIVWGCDIKNKSDRLVYLEELTNQIHDNISNG